MLRFAVYRCPEHKNETLLLEGDAGGTRLLGLKCCYAQHDAGNCIAVWPLTSEVVEACIEELEHARAEVERLRAHCCECERRRRHYDSDPEQFRDEDPRCSEHRTKEGTPCA